MTETARQAARRFAAPMLDKGFVPEGLYAYTDTDGSPLYWKLRAKHPGTGDKWIRPLHSNGAGWELSEPQFEEGKKPLYRLHELAAHPGEPAWWVEGEPKADVLAKLGLLATTSGSATSEAAVDFSPLMGRTLTIWPDNDAAGFEHAERVAQKARAHGCTVEIIDAAALGCPEGGDAVDWLKAHPNATAADLAKLPRLQSAPAPRLHEQPEGVAVHLLRGADVSPEPIDWLWRNYLARGKLHMIAGAPGAGKTTLALALAATMTKGGPLPDATRAPVGNVLIWSGEDDVRDVLLPRLLAMGADPARVFFVGDVVADGSGRPFDPARDMAALEREAVKVGNVLLFVVDPVVNAVAGDSHKNTETRRALQPIVELAARLRAAAVGVSHFSKGTAGRDPVERVTGSVAFGALPRLIFGAAKRSDSEGGGRVFVRAKSNIGPDGGGFGYDLDQIELAGFPGVIASRVLWGAPLEGAARDLLAVAEGETDQGDRSATDEAQQWLREELRDGPMKASVVQREAKQAGIGEKPLRTARERLCIKPKKRGFEGPWEWGLPVREDAQKPEGAQESVTQKEGIFGSKGHLGQRESQSDVPRDDASETF